MAKRIGFIGVGMMGQGMVKNLLKNGYEVTVMAHRNRAPIEALVKQGAKEAGNPAEVTAQSDVVILCVTGAPQVEEVIYGKNGILGAVREGVVLLDCSTSEPATTERVAKDFAERKAHVVDAPLARTPKEAEAGKLNTMVGCDEKVFAEIKPILETFCENIFYMGGVGAGSRTKLIYNLITMGHAALIAEAVCACAATGVDLARFAQVVGGGGANSGIFQMIVPGILERGDYSGLKFSLANAAKDLRYFNRMVADIPLAGPMAPAVHNALVQAINTGFKDGLVGDMVAAQCKNNGVRLK